MALGFGKVRVRLRVGIAVMFLSVMLPLTGLMTGILYRQNSQLAVQLAESAMEGASSDVVAGVRSLLGPMARVVELSADFGKEERGSLRRIEGLRPLVEELEKFTDLNALYFGFARDGAFYEAIRVPPPGSGLGLVGRHPPEKARYALRIIDDIDGERVDGAQPEELLWTVIDRALRAAGEVPPPMPQPAPAAAPAPPTQPSGGGK